MKEFILYILIYLKKLLKMQRIYNCKLDMMTWWLSREKFTMSLQLGDFQEKLLRQREKYM